MRLLAAIYRFAVNAKRTQLLSIRRDEPIDRLSLLGIVETSGHAAFDSPRAIGLRLPLAVATAGSRLVYF